ncbi:formamidopyrimidine-DNA glycosylase [Opitutaceae bacterium EW11]|nr:formamidopyrimidine-DNA glycosylase [Opitutaceae bacterium EW11]
MPELPDIVCYLEALDRRIVGDRIKRVSIANPFVLRTAVPPIDAVTGLAVVALRRIGKRIVLGFEKDYWLVIHLMVAGRLHWSSNGSKAPRSLRLADFEFSRGVLTLTEAGTKKRASIHLVQGETNLSAMDPGGIDVFACTDGEFSARLTERNATLKRALTDPHLFSGIGNAYSDEILHHARLSPVQLTQKLDPPETARLLQSVRTVLSAWTERLRAEAGAEFPERITAFRPEMAVHGKFGKPCPVCGAKVQRIRYADNETNYCPKCQTGGRLLADRSLSRLLKDDWPKSV